MTTKIIHNVETNKITEEALSQEEMEILQQQQIESEKRQAQREKELADAAAAKAALLEKLGITEEEAKLLLS